MKNDNIDEKRKLTDREIKRVAQTKETIEKYEAQGFKTTEKTVGIVKANVMAIVYCLPLIVVFTALWFIKNSISLDEVFGSLTKYIACVVALVLAIFVHEGIHGLCWGLSAKGGFKSIEFGFIKEMLTPYCTCKVPMSRVPYIIGGAMPGIVLGILPCVISILIGDIYWLFFGLMMVLGAGGDLQAILLLLRHKSEASEILCLDHPTKLGFYFLEK